MLAPRPREWLRFGVAYVPQGNRVFADLTVRENLEMGGIVLPGWQKLNNGLERVLGLFPALKPRMRRRAGTLSGGEEQMLALSMALLLSPRMLLLDEPSLGLAPALVTQALECIRQLSLDTHTSVPIVEQKVCEVLRISRRVYVLRNGSVSYSGHADVLRDKDEKLREVCL